MRAAWLFNDPLSGQWTVALDYQAQPCSPIYQVRVTSEYHSAHYYLVPKCWDGVCRICPQI